MNVSQLAHYRSLVPSMRRIGDGRYSVYWRMHDLISTVRKTVAMSLVPVAKGERSHGEDGTSGLHWAYFRDVHPRLVEAWLEVNGWERADVNGSHDCTGEFFARTPWVRRTGNRVLVIQSWGIDV